MKLQDILAALQLEPSPAQTGGLLKYLDLLERWNATYNLTAVRDRAAMLTQHLADCLAIIPPLQRRGLPARVLDVGSGGGLPAVVIATLLPQCDVTAVDAVGKKMAFIRQVAGALPLKNLHAEHGRVEQLRKPPFDLITSRAFASLADFVHLTRHLLAPEGAWLAMKGRVPDDEIQALPDDVDVFHVEHLQVPGMDAKRCLIWMRTSARSPST